MKKRQELATQMQIEGVKDVRGQINGSACGYDLSTHGIIRKGFTSSKIPINTNDFSLEYYGTFIGSAGAGKETIIGDPESIIYGVGTFRAYARNLEESYRNSLIWLLFEKSISNDNTGDSVLVNYYHPDDNPFHVVITRQGTTVKVYIEGVLKATREQSAIKDMGMFPLCIANASDARQARVFNYALSADEVTALYNAGKPEEYVIKETMKNISSIDFGTQITYFGTAFGGIVSNDTVNKVYTIDATNLYPDKDYATSYLYGFKFRDKVKYKFKVKIVSNKDFTTTIYPLVRNYQIKEGDNYIDITAESFNNNWLHIYPTRGVIITLSEFDIREVGCIAEYLPQNLISTNDGEMNATTATKWLDSAKQLPLNDEYLEPLLESIGGYDLTASGTPEIVYKPNVILKVTNIDLYNIKPAFASNQTDAYYQYMDYGLYINTGNYLPSIARPALAIRYPCITGRSYKIEVEYSSLYGNMKLDFINIDGTTNISSTNLQYIETGESYKYTSEITKRIGDGAYFNLYFKNSIANSEMLISKIIIYEYQ